MINKKLGNDFEQELCQILADAGYWTHNLTKCRTKESDMVIK